LIFISYFHIKNKCNFYISFLINELYRLDRELLMDGKLPSKNFGIPSIENMPSSEQHANIYTIDLSARVDNNAGYP